MNYTRASMDKFLSLDKFSLQSSCNVHLQTFRRYVTLTAEREDFLSMQKQ